MKSAAQRISVAVVTDAIYPYHRGGKEIRYYEMLPRVRGALDVRVYTMHWWSERSHTRWEHGVEYEAVCRLFALYNDVRRSMLEAIAFALACLRLIGRRFDIVEADHMPYLQLFTLRLVTSLKRRPLVVTWHEVWGPEYWHTYLGRLSGTIAWWIERVSMSLPDEILAVSEGTADRLRSFVGDSVRIRVVPNAIDLDLIRRVEPAPSGESADLLYVGRLLSHKGVDQLLDAVASLRPEHRLEVLIVGDGPAKVDLEKQVLALGLNDIVRFRADVGAHEEVFALMKAAQVFVLPSVREGFGIAVLEALACGTPVVTTSHPDNQARYLAERSDRGFVATPDASGLARAIEEALAASAGPRRPVESWLEEFDWSRGAAQYVDAMIDLVGGRAASEGLAVAPASAR